MAATGANAPALLDTRAVGLVEDVLRGGPVAASDVSGVVATLVQLSRRPSTQGGTATTRLASQAAAARLFALFEAAASGRQRRPYAHKSVAGVVVSDAGRRRLLEAVRVGFGVADASAAATLAAVEGPLACVAADCVGRADFGCDKAFAAFVSLWVELRGVLKRRRGGGGGDDAVLPLMRALSTVLSPAEANRKRVAAVARAWRLSAVRQLLAIVVHFEVLSRGATTDVDEATLKAAVTLRHSVLRLLCTRERLRGMVCAEGFVEGAPRGMEVDRFSPVMFRYYAWLYGDGGGGGGGDAGGGVDGSDKLCVLAAVVRELHSFASVLRRDAKVMEAEALAAHLKEVAEAVHTLLRSRWVRTGCGGGTDGAEAEVGSGDALPAQQPAAPAAQGEGDGGCSHLQHVRASRQRDALFTSVFDGEPGGIDTLAWGVETEATAGLAAAAAAAAEAALFAVARSSAAAATSEVTLTTVLQLAQVAFVHPVFSVGRTNLYAAMLVDAVCRRLQETAATATTTAVTVKGRTALLLLADLCARQPDTVFHHLLTLLPAAAAPCPDSTPEEDSLAAHRALRAAARVAGLSGGAAPYTHAWALSFAPGGGGAAAVQEALRRVQIGGEEPAVCFPPPGARWAVVAAQCLLQVDAYPEDLAADVAAATGRAPPRLPAEQGRQHRLLLRVLADPLFVAPTAAAAAVAAASTGEAAAEAAALLQGQHLLRFPAGEAAWIRRLPVLHRGLLAAGVDGGTEACVVDALIEAEALGGGDDGNDELLADALLAHHPEAAALLMLRGCSAG